MKILLTGGTGFIGQALCEALLAQQHELIVLSRRVEQVASICGEGVEAISSFAELSSPVDVVINLAGEPIVDKRWSDARKKQLEESRIGVTRQLIEHIKSADWRPELIISGSAIGAYGDQGATPVTEQSVIDPAPDDFAQALCMGWEAEASKAEALDVPLALLRIGLVVGPDGGFLQRMLLPFKLGLGGPIGDGQQWMSWIHRDDLMRMIIWLIEQGHTGVFNATAPAPVTNKDFASELGKQLKRPAFMPMPGFALKLAMGEMATLLLTGQKVLPERSIALGFNYDFPNLATALEAVVGGS